MSEYGIILRFIAAFAGIKTENQSSIRIKHIWSRMQVFKHLYFVPIIECKGVFYGIFIDE